MSSFSASLPIWYQLNRTLRSEILNGKRRPGEQLEPEIRMAERFGVSVAPVRQALRALEQDGLIVRRRGSGTYVNDVSASAQTSKTPLESLFSREFSKRAVIFALGSVSTPAPMRPYFSDVESIGYVRRLAYRDNKPWSYGTLYFRLNYAPRLTKPRFERYPLYRLLKEHCGVEATHSHFEVKAATAGAEVAAHLEVEPFSPILSVMSVGFDIAGRAIGGFEVDFPSEPFVFEFETAH